jgi:hypothetical protein
MKQLRLTNTPMATVGSIISVQVDPRDVPQAKALLGIAYEVSPSGTGGCLVVTLSGILCKSNKQNYYVPKTKYNILDNNVAIEPRLRQLRSKILDGTFDSKNYERLSTTMAHGQEYKY